MRVHATKRLQERFGWGPEDLKELARLIQTNKYETAWNTGKTRDTYAMRYKNQHIHVVVDIKAQEIVTVYHADGREKEDGILEDTV